jgi:hypothetical protein
MSAGEGGRLQLLDAAHAGDRHWEVETGREGIIPPAQVACFDARGKLITARDEHRLELQSLPFEGRASSVPI